MISAIDTNVLLDVLGADPAFGERSRQALKACANEGVLVACDPVWAELAGLFDDSESASEALDDAVIAFDSLSRQAALVAGQAWSEHRRRGGRRGRVVADFLVGAHAAVQADRLVTRDRGFYRAYFADLEILDPGRLP